MKWLEIKKEKQIVLFANGTPFAVGQKVSMGLGSIELRQTEKAGLHVVRWSKSGHFGYSVSLSKDGVYRLCANRGHRVITPQEESDPIKKILRELDIPVSRLRFASESTLKVDEYWYDNHHSNVGRGTNYWVSDGSRTHVNSEMLEKPQGLFDGGGCCTSVIEGASYAISIDSGRYMNGCGWTRPGEVVVWPHCDPSTLSRVLRMVCLGDKADPEYVRALEDVEVARRWIRTKYESVEIFHNNKREVVFLGREGYFFGGFRLVGLDPKKIVPIESYFQSTGPIGELVKRHGFKVVKLPVETTIWLYSMGVPNDELCHVV